MLVVSDTSPITVLLQTGLDHLLPELFQHVIIPPAVRAELLQTHPILPGWLEVCAPSSIPSAVRDAHLDLGETEALALALELHADAILLDEQIGAARSTRSRPACHRASRHPHAREANRTPPRNPARDLDIAGKSRVLVCRPARRAGSPCRGGISHGIAVELRAHFPGEIQQSFPKLCRIDAREFSRKRKTPVP